MGPTHRVFGALSGAAYASVTGEPLHVMAFMALVATATSNGPFSPDGDQTKPWQEVGQKTGPLRPLFAHRSGLTHWWGVPVLAWLALTEWVPAGNQWPWIGLIIGWVSHLLGDFIFGRINLFPWGGPSFGLGFKTNGFLEAGKFRLIGRTWAIPFGPTRVALGVALVAVFVTQPGMPRLAWPDVDLPGITIAAAANHADGILPDPSTHHGARVPDYRRAEFGPDWYDEDRNGCRTRDDILRRDLTKPVLRPGSKCVIVAGTLTKDLYTGKTLTFAKANASAIQIDHIVSLSDGWHTGAHSWTPQQRRAFANDPFNLVAVDGPTNAAKNDHGPDTWSPANKAGACRYVTRYTLVKAKWGLTTTPEQAASISHTLDACENGEAP